MYYTMNFNNSNSKTLNISIHIIVVYINYRNISFVIIFYFYINIIAINISIYIHILWKNNFDKHNNSIISFDPSFRWKIREVKYINTYFNDHYARVYANIINYNFIKARNPIVVEVVKYLRIKDAFDKVFIHIATHSDYSRRSCH